MEIINLRCENGARMEANGQSGWEIGDFAKFSFPRNGPRGGAAEEIRRIVPDLAGNENLATFR